MVLWRLDCQILLLLLLLLHAARREGRRVVALDALLGTPFTWLLLLTLQVQTSTRLASLRNATVLDDGRLRLRIVLVMAEQVALQQISTRKGLGADLALIWLFLGVHAHVATQVIEARITFGTLATGVQTGSSTWPGAGGRLSILLLLRRLSIVGGVRIGGGGRLVLRARALLRRFAVVLIDVGGGRGARASVHLHGLGSRRRRRRQRRWATPGQMIAHGRCRANTVSKWPRHHLKSSQNVGTTRVLVPLQNRKWRESHDLRLLLLLRVVEPSARAYSLLEGGRSGSAYGTEAAPPNT